MVLCEVLSGLFYRKKYYWYKMNYGFLKIVLKMYCDLWILCYLGM